MNSNNFTFDNYACEACGELCEVVEESFDYAGTHCNHGNSGTHKTGKLESKCCGDYFESPVYCESCGFAKHKDFMSDFPEGYFCKGCCINPEI